MPLRDVPSQRACGRPPSAGSSTGLGQGGRPPACLSSALAPRGRQCDKELGQKRSFSQPPGLSSGAGSARGLVDPPSKRRRSLEGVRFNSQILSSEINNRTRPAVSAGSGPLPSILPGCQETAGSVAGLPGLPSSQRGASIRAFQDGRLAHGQVPPQARRLSDVPGHIRRLPTPVDCTFRSTVSPFYLGRSSLSVSSGLLRPGDSTAHFHETASPRRSNSPSGGNSLRNLPRRHFTYQFVAPAVSRSNTVFSRSTGLSGFSDQSKVRSGAFSDSGFFGNDDRHSQNGAACSVRESQKISRLSETHTACAGRGSVDSPPISRRDWQNYRHDASSAPSSVTVETPTLRQEPSAGQVRQQEVSLEFNGGSFTGSSQRTRAMASNSAVLERPLHHSAPQHSGSPDNGRQSLWLGGMVENAQLPRFLDSPGGSAQQQRARADGDGAFCAGSTPEFFGEDSGDSYRQHDNDGLHKSSGRPESFIDGDSSPLMGVGSPDGHHHFLDVPRWQDERESRPTVAGETRSVRLDAEQEVVFAAQQNLGPFYDGHVRNAPERAASTLLFLAPGSDSNRSRCVSAGSQQGAGVRQSSFQSNQQILVAHQATAGDVCCDSPSMAVTTLVAAAQRDDHRRPNSPSGSQRSFSPGPLGERSANGSPTVARDRSACLRRALLDKGISAAMAQQLCNQWREATQKGYGSLWNRWFDFCQAARCSPVRASAQQIGEFLTKLSVVDGASGSVVNSARSSIVGVVQVVTEQRKLAKHPLLAGVTKTAKLLRPVQPRYDTIWDVGELLAYWKRTPALTLVMKRAKAISLFILATYARPSDCERLSMARGHFGIAQSRNSYMYRIRGSKESKSSHKLTPELYVEFFDESSPDVDLCPARAMAAYGDAVDDSKRVPRAAMVHPYGFFVSEALRPFPGADGKFFTPLSSQRISKIMKGVMSLAGIDTTVFKGGSGRHAASSAAADNNVPFEQILLTGRWSSFQVWNKFYHRARLNASTRKMLVQPSTPSAAAAPEPLSS